MVREDLGAVDGVGVVQDVVSERLDKEGRVGRDVLGESGERVVARSEDGLVADGELGEKGLAGGVVGDARSDGDKTGEVGLAAGVSEGPIRSREGRWLGNKSHPRARERCSKIQQGSSELSGGHSTGVPTMLAETPT